MGATKDLFIQIQDSIMNEINNYENGNSEILNTIISLRESQHFCDEISQNIKDFESENIEKIENSAKDYNWEFKGFSIKVIQERKTFDFSNIPEIKEKELDLKNTKTKYQTAWEQRQKDINSVDDNGELLQVPEVKYSKSYLQMKKI